MPSESISILLAQIGELRAEIKELYQRIDSLEGRANSLQRFALLNPNVVRRSVFVFLHSAFGYIIITFAVGLVYLIVIGIVFVFAASSNQPAPIIVPTTRSVRSTTAIVAPTARPSLTFYRTSTPNATALTFYMRLTSAASNASTSEPTSTKRANVVYPTATPGVGRIVINNRLDIGLRFTFWGVSEISVDVAPGQTSILELPPGSYGWTSIFLNDSRQCQLTPTENLNLSGTFTITIIPAQNYCGADIQYG